MACGDRDEQPARLARLHSALSGREMETRKREKVLRHPRWIDRSICSANELDRMSILAAHTDSPALKLKPHPEIEKKNMVQLGVEVYGAPILPTWTNRDLAIAGRVIVEREDGEIEELLVLLDDAPVIIPVLAPHLDREAFKRVSSSTNRIIFPQWPP